mgnify:CR=1 FL=1
MSKKGFHGNGRYYYENGYYSKKAVRETYPEGNDEKIRGINKVRDELMRKIDSVTRSYAGKCAGRMLSDVVNEIYGIFTEECEKLREAGYVESVSEEIIKNTMAGTDPYKYVLIREYNKLNASGEHDER